MTYLYYQTSTANVGGHIKTDDKTKEKSNSLGDMLYILQDTNKIQEGRIGQA